MANFVVEGISDREVWEEFVLAYPAANFLQSWNWGDFHLAIGNRIYRKGFYVDGALAGVMLCVVEDARRGRYLTVPAGPLIAWEDGRAVEAFVDEVKRIALAEKCAFVRVRPPLVANQFSEALFQKLGFVSAPIHLHAELTSQLDITQTEEQLLAHMRKGTRYEIKKGVSVGVTVTATEDPAAIKEFYDLQIATSQRQHFVPFSYQFFYEQFKVFAGDKKALLYRAEFEGKLLAQAFIIFYGREAAYHYGASTEEGRSYPGAYLIQWEAIKEAKRRGMERYNFWGVAAESQKGHRFYSLSIFKRGFGGADVEYLHARDFVVNRFRYLANLAVEKVRKYVRRV